MHWASVDSFLTDDPFWQSRMGMPVANKQFLDALLQHGSCSSYRFFCPDTSSADRLSRMLEARFPNHAGRIEVFPQSLLPFHLEGRPADVFHNGDFTFYMPYLLEWRNRLPARRRFPVTGVTHSLDTTALYAKFISLLLATPRPYDAIVCTSRCAVEALHRAFGEIRESFRERVGADLPDPPRLVHIPLGIPVRPKPLPPRDEVRRKMAISPRDVVVLTLGRFSARAKMDLSPFLEGFARLAAALRRGKGPNVRLVLAGAAKKENVRLVAEMIKTLGLGDVVHLHPNVSDEEKESLYAAADIFCSTVDNYQETFGLTLLEAMDAGLPIVASDFNGYRDLVINGQTGFLVPTYASCSQEPWDGIAGILDPSVLRFYRAQKIAFDVEAFVKALYILTRRADLRALFSGNAKRRVEDFRWHRIIRAYEDLWRNLGSMARSEMDTTEKAVDRALITPTVTKIFPHYPSETLQETSILVSVDFNTSHLGGEIRPLRYKELDPFIREEVLHSIMSKASHRETALSQLLQSECVTWGLDREAVIMHVDWLIKHGMLVPKKC